MIIVNVVDHFVAEVDVRASTDYSRWYYFSVTTEAVIVVSALDVAVAVVEPVNDVVQVVDATTQIK